MAHVGLDDGRAYFKDALTDATLLNPDSKKSADLRGVVNALNRRRPDRDAISNGPLPSGERQAYVDMWRRGLDELRAWLSDASGPLARLVP